MLVMEQLIKLKINNNNNNSVTLRIDFSPEIHQDFINFFFSILRNVTKLTMRSYFMR